MVSTLNILGFFALRLVGLTMAQQTDILTKMQQHRVVPDVIPSAPANLVTVNYGQLKVDLGNELTPTQVHDKPVVSWPVEDGAYYTLIMNDPDVPPHIAKEVQHWLVVNIPGNDISKGETLFDYIGSGPPKGTGLHRYIFLAFKQPGKLEKTKFSDIQEVTIESRRQYELKKIIESLGLGTPVAGNLYVAQYDDNVPSYHAERRKQFESKPIKP